MRKYIRSKRDLLSCNCLELLSSLGISASVGYDNKRGSIEELVVVLNNSADLARVPGTFQGIPLKVSQSQGNTMFRDEIRKVGVDDGKVK